MEASLPDCLVLAACSTPVLLVLYYFLLHLRAEQNDPKGCRKLGLGERSNLSDEYDPKYSHGCAPGKDASGGPRWKVKALIAYPIKSCAAVEFDIANVVTTGLEHDRHFCFAEFLAPRNVRAEASEKEKAPRWEFRTMRDGKYSKLALIRPEVWVADPSVSTYSPDLEEVRSGGVLVIHYPRTPRGSLAPIVRLGMAAGILARERSFRVPLNPPKGHNYPSREVRIWKEFPVSWDYGVHVPQELKDFFGSEHPVTLFRTDPAHFRDIFRCAPRVGSLGFQPITGFADAYPLHILNLASVRHINRRCEYAIPKLSSLRFRSNIVLEGPAAYEEDSWKRIQIGGSSRGVEIHTVCRTVRCRLPNVNPDTGERHSVEPDKTLKSFRCIDPGDKKNACLGMQAVPAQQDFILRVGDEVEVLERGEHFYIKQ